MAKDIIPTINAGNSVTRDITLVAIQSLDLSTCNFGGWATSFGDLLEKFYLSIVITNTWKYFTENVLHVKY